MDEDRIESRASDRKLGDEWLDWDGSQTAESAETNYGVFLGLAVLSTLALIVAAGLFLWLIYPRLYLMGELAARLVSIIFFAFSGILLLWLLLFVWAAVMRRPMTRLIIIPQLVNRLLSIVMALGKFVGVSRDRLTNSFLKIHNVILGSKALRTTPDRLLLLLPRCLTRDDFKRMRQLRDQYRIKMATVGGGSEARLKIKEVQPQVIIAIACERDLLSGFRDVNTHIPVIGFPNRRPEGPCKNTCVDAATIEKAIKSCLD
jgi:hypothetical protein